MNACDIKERASGYWAEIICTLAPQLATTVKRDRRHGPCDLCGGVDRCRCHNDFADTGGIICNQCGGGFDGLAVLQWANGWTFPEALEAVANYLGLTESTFAGIIKQTPLPKPAKDWSRERKQVEQIWKEAISDHPRLKDYLEYRGLDVELPPTLRLHPTLEYWFDGKSYGEYPCIVARIIRDGGTVGIHRTFLDPNEPRKANVPKAKLSKKCAESITGGCIRLFQLEQDKPLVLCEGIETALAIHEYSGWPVWPCVSRTLLEKVKIPNDVKSVIIGADKDRSGDGQASAEKLAQRLLAEGNEVKISLPPMEISEGSSGVDWLDFLNKEVCHV